MTREDVVRIALEVGFYDGKVDKCQLMLERFAYLVAQQEREACAKIADIAEPYNSADLIRARGQA
jgi:hypothetical protein